MSFEWYELGFFLLLYSFLGWCAEMLVYAFTSRSFRNVGFLTMPLILTYGFTMTVLIVVLPFLGDNVALQLIMTLMVSAVIDALGVFIAGKLSGVAWPRRAGMLGGNIKGFAASVVIALAFFLAYQIFQPLVIFLLPLIPKLVLRIVTDAILVFVIIDLVTVSAAFRRGNYANVKNDSRSAGLADKLVARVWSRVKKAYPEIETGEKEYIFGKGLSADKLVWVFLISSLLGDLIETLYCGFVNGEWMSRSSLLYGPFSLVWGIGAVVLTVSLLPLSKKNDRWVFIGGFFIGGAYEYLCSVFTELVFGTVFWDYSYMPLNIGGRTNVLFMFFWGLLSVVWIKSVYPPMSKAIERIPPIAGKLITWIIVAAMLLNGSLTGMAMLRYNFRRAGYEAASDYDAFLDTNYTDERIEKRWPNMIIVEETEG